MPGSVGFHLVGNGRPRAYQRHIATQHVNELRQFIKARAPQKVSYGCDSRVVRKLEDFLARFVRLFVGLTGNEFTNIFLVLAGIVVYVHRAELQESERRAVLSNALLPEQDRTAGSQFDRRSDHEKDG